MFQILDVSTLLRQLNIAPEAVHDTIEAGGWSGCVWPGHAEWEDHEACIQIRSLALHYFTVRQPTALPQRYETASQILASQGCPQGGVTHLDTDPLVDQALLWLWALAGGPTPQDMAAGITLPGGDPEAFTVTALAMLEALIFVGNTATQQVASTFLQLHADAPSQRALELVDAIVRRDNQGQVEAGVTCADCGAQDLELWYTGKTWGDTLCEPCYEARIAHGQAQPGAL
jgi:hypothetical protein